MKQEFLNLILGNATWITYVAGFVFVFFGLVIKWYIEINRAIKGNDNTPDRWDWRYFLQNNLFKKLFSIFANIIIAFVALRFSTEIFNIPLSMALSLAIGIGFDEVVNRISKWQKKLK